MDRVAVQTVVVVVAASCSSAESETGGDDGGTVDTSVGDAGDDVVVDADGDSSASGGASNTLFDEDGLWSLVRYDIGDGLMDVNQAVRKDAFLLEFDSAVGVVTTATCGAAGADTPDSSVCRQNPSLTAWTCRCFAYAFVDDTMQWREFDAGAAPPDVAFVPPPGDGDLYVTASETQLAGGYGLAPLPLGVFGSDGTSSSFVFVERASTIIDEAYVDPEGACTPCVP